MQIGLISDTHSHIDELILSHFQNCDEIWHAGDIGDYKVIERLQKIAPVRSVFGNIDDNDMRNIYPENNFISIGSLNILITHIAGTPPKFNTRIKNLIKENKVDVLICGHSHILRVERDPVNKLIYINPGAAGVHGFHKMRTIMTFKVSKDKLEDMKVIELGKRGQI